MLSDKLLEILVCPNCKKELEYDREHSKLICRECRLKFDIKDDIPVMLVDEAERF